MTTNPISGVRCKQLLKSNVHAVDGEIGKIKDIYFDDTTWALRYLVADTGNWLPGRKVLLSPHSLIRDAFSGDAVAVNLSKEQIRNSPEIGSDKPVSIQEEEKLGSYYGWPPVVPAPIIGGGMMTAGYTYTGAHYAHTGMPPTAPPPPNESADKDRADYDPHLRSVREVMGYKIEVSDGEIGEVEDFLVDLNDSRLVSIISEAPRRREVFLPMETVNNISWDRRAVTVRASRDQIEVPSLDR